MGDTERVLGRLEEFKESTEKKLDALDKKVEALTSFKWRATGFMAALMGGFEVVKMFLEHQR
jgi:hypothetical protein